MRLGFRVEMDVGLAGCLLCGLICLGTHDVRYLLPNRSPNQRVQNYVQRTLMMSSQPDILGAQAVRFEIDMDVGFIVIDNPPVNAGSISVRIGIRDAVRKLAADDRLIAGVIIGAGKTFMGGSDINEFGKPLLDPDLPLVLLEIEQCPKPIVAAMHGAALGGGYELALACDSRVAAREALVGLPEVTLGMIPGAGGTQRLPKLVGVAKAIDLIVSGERVSATRAAEIGMIDAVADSDLRGFAAAAGRRLVGLKKNLSKLALPDEASEDIAKAAEAAFKKGRGREAVHEAVRIIKLGMHLPFDQAIIEERKVFQRLRVGDEAAALRYNFFAERQAVKLDGMTGLTARQIHKVGVVGAGTMGAGIAALFAASGYDVTLTDKTAQALKRGMGLFVEALHQLERSGMLGRGGMATAQARLSSSITLDMLAHVDLIVEAVVEDIAVKREVLSKLGAILKLGAIVASNTSYLDIEELALATERPGDVIAMHFFAPVHRMRLVEVVRNSQTAPDVLLTGVKISRAIGKLPIVAGSSEGFIGNRIFSKYRQQCEFLLEEGALPQEIDAALVDLGFAMGPFAVADLSGLDIAWRNRQRKTATRDPRERYVDIPDRICELGRLGYKTGAGWYSYAGEVPGNGKPDPVVTEIIRQRAAKCSSLNSLTAEEIQRRALGAIFNEASLIIEEGVARTGGEIDLVLVNGFGFSKFKGGPLFVCSQMPQAEVQSMVAEVEAATGFGFKRGDVVRLHAELQR